MKRYVDLVRDENPNYLWTSWQGNYGDWLHGDTLKAEGYPKGYATMPKEVFATAFFALSSRLLSKMAKILGKDAHFQEYSDLSQKNLC